MNIKFKVIFLLITSIELFGSHADNLIKPEDVTITNQWATGYESKINVSQLKAPWTITFDLNSENQKVTSIWGVHNPDQVNKASSHIQVSNPAWHTQEIGFVVSKAPQDTPGIKNIAVNIGSNEKKNAEPAKVTPTPPAQSVTQKRPENQNADTKHAADTKKRFDTPPPYKPSHAEAQSKYHVIGYLPNWYRYRSPSLTLDDVQGDKLTILNYAFAKPYTTSAAPRNGIKPNVINYRASLSDPWGDCGGSCWSGSTKDLPNLSGPTGCDLKNVCPPKLAGNFAQIPQLKEKYPHLKIMISIGGWTMEGEGVPADQFSIMASKPETRKEFIDSCLELCARFGFDGIDLDWEYPGYSPNGTPIIYNDTDNFTLLLKELHATLKNKKLLAQVYDQTYAELKSTYDKLATYEKNNTPSPVRYTPPPQGLMLTIAGPAGLEKMKNIKLSEIHNYVDLIMIMSYDYGGGWPGQLSYHLAPLYASQDADPTLCADFAVDYYIEQGVPLQKIVMGVALYGRSAKFDKKDEKEADEKNGLLVKVSQAGPGTVEAGAIDYNDLTKNYLNDAQNQGKQGYVYHWDEKALVPWLYNPETKVFIGFDNFLATQHKAQYIKQKELRGAMIWLLENNANSWKAVKLIKDTLQ